MMKSTTIYEDGHQWYMFGRDPEKTDGIIDSNQYMIKKGDKAILLDPGGIELFSPMLSAALQHAGAHEITDLFASHQDPDIISSLGFWDKAIPDATLHAPWLWESFIKHYGCENITYNPIPDEGMQMDFNGIQLQFIPAHYLHSSGNYHVYDPQSKILMSGDIGASLDKSTPESEQSIWVENFDEHIQHARYFHQRWMPSEQAKKEWIERVRRMDIEVLAPQHGKLYKGEMVGKFLDWLETLEVGVASNKEQKMKIYEPTSKAIKEIEAA